MKFIEAKSRKEALKSPKAIGAEKIVKVEGGYMAFKTIVDYLTWKNQK